MDEQEILEAAFDRVAQNITGIVDPTAESVGFPLNVIMFFYRMIV